MFCVIVDGYSTGSGLATEFSKQGFSCIHVQSQPIVPKVYSHTFNSNDYLANYIYEGSVETLVEKLSKYQPKFVIAGAECGIELADYLAETLGLVGNGIALSSCRRNKYLMLETIKSKGLRVIPSCCVSAPDEAIAWASEQGGKRLIVKPLNSAGGEGVRLCESLEEVEQACLDIFSTKVNMLGFENSKVLLQHYIEGQEYVVNTVSYDGQHKLCELWQYTRYQRPSGRQIYDTASVVEYNDEIHGDIIKYAMNVINALGVKFGPAHVEVIKDQDGCYLIELGARLMGANLPFALLAQCISTPQSLMTVMAYSNPNKFKQQSELTYKVQQPLMAVFMVSNQSGVVKSIQHLEKIQSCESFFDMKLAVRVGDRLHKTIDYQTSPGMIYLSHKDKNVIMADKVRIRGLENTMFSLSETPLVTEKDVEPL